MNIEDLVRDNIKDLKAFSSARAEFSGEAEVFLDANENPFDHFYNRYPDPHHNALRRAISNWRGVDTDSIILGNGSDELIDMIIRTFCMPGRDLTRVIVPTFGMYQVSCDINDVILEEVQLADGFQLDSKNCLANQTERHRILILCSPNNPTGNDLDRGEMLKAIKGWKGLVIVDEAYIDFSDGESLLAELSNYPNLIILQTFSKALASAGLRIGMCFAHPKVIKYLNKVKPPYNIGVHEQRVGIEILHNTERVEREIENIVNERERLLDLLNAESGIIKAYPSAANFLLIKCTYHLKLKGFLQENGIIVRDRSKLPNCENCLRITIGKPKENELFIKKLREFYSS